jgi:hypothetical protein
MELIQTRGSLGGWLGEVGDFSLAEWGIALPAIVVGKRDGLPSGRMDAADPSGFWAWCRDHGIDTSNPPHIALEHQAKVYTRVE